MFSAIINKQPSFLLTSVALTSPSDAAAPLPNGNDISCARRCHITGELLQLFARETKHTVRAGRGKINMCLSGRKRKVCPSEAAAPMISHVLNTAVSPAVNLRGGDEEEVVNM